MLKLGSWNIRGLNSLIKQREVKYFIRSNSLSFYAVLETHVVASKIDLVASTLFGSWS